MWKTNWLQFIEDLKGVPFIIDYNEVAKAATNEEVAGIERRIGETLPPRFRKFLLSCSAGVDIGWRLEDGALVKLEDERESIYAGELSFHIDDFLNQNLQFQYDLEPAKYDYEYCPANLLAFASTPNGDQFAVVLSGPDIDCIKYLSHDIDDIHLYKVGDDILSFLSNYGRIGFAGPEYWVWQQFTNQLTTPIDSGSAKAAEFLNAIRRGVRSSEAEAEYRRAIDASRLVNYQQFILPKAERLRQMKNFDGFVELLSDYSDLLSGSIKVRYEYLLKKKIANKANSADAKSRASD